MIVDHTQHLDTTRTRLYRMRDLFRVAFHPKFRNDVRCLAPFCPRGGIYADVGANHGRVTRELARLHGGNCRVLAFEPTLYNLRVLNHQSKRKNVQVFDFGLSDQVCDAELLVPLRPNKSWAHGSARVVTEDGLSEFDARPETFVRQTIHARPLDEVLAEQGVDRLDFIKLDVEGHEPFVLRGGARTIDACKPSILMEVRPSAAEPVGLLAERGYSFYDVELGDDGAWTQDVAALMDRIRDKHHDVLCWHPDGPVGAGGAPPSFGLPFHKTRF